MLSAVAVIRKVGNEYCVFSHSGKNLGCSSSKEGATQRLREVEYFKDKGSNNMNYDAAFNNISKNLDPKLLGQLEQVQASELVDERMARVLDKRGSIAGRHSDLLLDSREHFPVLTPAQAQSSMTRALQLTDVPVWYNGNLKQLQLEVYNGAIANHPDLKFNIKVPVEQAVGLSDGQTPSETTTKSVENPADVAPTQVPGIKRGKLTGAEVEAALSDESNRKIIAGRLLEMVDQQLARVQEAKKLAEQLLSKGLKAAEFDGLSTYIQENIMHELLSKTSSASAQVDRRQELLERLGRNS